jgi:hypothetical protein
MRNKDAFLFFSFFSLFFLPWTQRDNGINSSEMRFEDKIRYTSPVATRKPSKENAENPDVGCRLPGYSVPQAITSFVIVRNYRIISLTPKRRSSCQS